MFKPIPGWEAYEISEGGEVYSHRVGRLLSPQLNTSGYYFITLTDDLSNQKRFLVHRLLAFVFLDLPSLDSELEVDHDDNNKLNNKLKNLVVRSKQEHLKKTLSTRGHNIRSAADELCSCGNTKERRASTCEKCFNENRILIKPEITVELIEYWVVNFSWVRASKELGLSDNGLRKRYKKLTGKDPKSLKKNNTSLA